jgi:cytochrome c biogenesis protein CcmG, thiol:disulfide interchange protein DsbE
VRGLTSKLSSAGVLLFAVAIVVVFARPSYRQGEPSVAGKRAYDFAIELDGRSEHLSDLRGKVVVLNFWASWCPPCVDEVASLNELQFLILPRGGTVLGVSVDEDPAAYRRFLEQHNVSFPNYRDPTKKIAETYGTVMYPETYVIDANGRIARKIVGPQDWSGSELAGYIESLLPAPANHQ